MKDIFKNINKEFIESPTIVFEPIGLKPKEIWLLERMNDINCAILRYKQVNIEVPKEWILELKDIASELVVDVPIDKDK